MLKLTILANLLAIAFASDQLKFDTVYQWKFINYNWPSINALLKAFDNGEYIPRNNVVAGLKFWKDKMYLTIPRWKTGVPATLAVTSSTPRYGITNPVLDPFPNWDMQTIGDCSAFQSVQSMEIDPLGRMWVIDTGKTETSTSDPVSRCPPRLIILDLENNGSVLRTYVFPNEVAPYDTVQLNDIVLDHEDGGTAFITDSETADPGIIVYSLKANKSWKVRHNCSMRAQEEAVGFTVNGTELPAALNIDGIALSPPGPNRHLYYSPMSSYHLYSVPVSALKNDALKSIDDYVSDLGRWDSQKTGMVMTNQGVLYVGLVAQDAVGMWDTKEYSSFGRGATVISTDHDTKQMIDTFAIEAGRIWFTSNRLQNFFANKVDISEPNYRVLRSTSYCRSRKNYQYLEDGTAPELPAIAAADDDHC